MFSMEDDHFTSLPAMYWDSFLGDNSMYKAFNCYILPQMSLLISLSISVTSSLKMGLELDNL